MIDSYKHKGLRKKLVEQLKGKGIEKESVLEAINQVPRHLFMDNAFVNFAYKDQAFPIGSDQTISQPYTVAFQSQLLQIEKGHKVLEIGTGSGYQAAVLLELSAKVFSIERHRSLHKKAKQKLDELGYSGRFFFGDGFEGLPAFAPFDRILITAAAPRVPEKLLAQLKIGGFLVIPLGSGESQEMLRITKLGEDDYQEEKFGTFSFVPMLANKSFSS